MRRFRSRTRRSPRASLWYPVRSLASVTVLPNQRVGFQMTRPFDGFATTNEPTIVDPTLVRIRGNWSASSANGLGGTPEVSTAFGIIKMRADSAGNAVTAALPDPLDNADMDWIYHEYIVGTTFSAGLQWTSGTGVSGTGIDSKAKRIMRDGEILVMVIRTSTQNTDDLKFRWATRLLFNGQRK